MTSSTQPNTGSEKPRRVNREFLGEAVRAEEEDACVPNIAAIGKHAFRACRLRLLDEFDAGRRARLLPRLRGWGESMSRQGGGAGGSGGGVGTRGPGETQLETDRRHIHRKIDKLKAELEEVRGGMLRLRDQLARELEQLSGSDRFRFIAQHRGMFSRLGASPEVVQKIKDDFAIYMVGDSRLNIAGLNDTTVPILARAIVEAGI